MNSSLLRSTYPGDCNQEIHETVMVPWGPAAQENVEFDDVKFRSQRQTERERFEFTMQCVEGINCRHVTRE
jgi:hypothetical protein